MSLRYIIDAFKTKQVLDKSYKRYAEPFAMDNWWGEYDEEYDRDLVARTLDAFDKAREKHFELIHQSDYRDTYRSRDFTPTHYLKHYRTFEAKYSRSTILKRNLLRRTLAKKPFVLAYRLQSLGIPTITNAFYAAEHGHYIPRNALYVSIEAPGSLPLDFFLRSLGNFSNAGSYTERFNPRLPEIPMPLLMETFGKFCKQVVEAGVRIFYKEMIANTLVRVTDGSPACLLCDLDIIGAISPLSRPEREERLREIGRDLERRVKRYGLTPEIEAYYRGALG